MACAFQGVACIAARHKAGQPQPQHGAQHERTAALHHRGRRGRSARGQTTLQHMEKPRVPNAEGRAAAGWALGCGEAGARLQCTGATRALPDARSEKDPLARDAQTHTRARGPPSEGTLPCWWWCALPSAKSDDTAAATSKEPSAKPVRRRRHGPHAAAITSDQSRRPRRTMAATAARPAVGIDGGKPRGTQ